MHAEPVRRKTGETSSSFCDDRFRQQPNDEPGGSPSKRSYQLGCVPAPEPSVADQRGGSKRRVTNVNNSFRKSIGVSSARASAEVQVRVLLTFGHLTAQ